MNVSSLIFVLSFCIVKILVNGYVLSKNLVYVTTATFLHPIVSTILCFQDQVITEKNLKKYKCYICGQGYKRQLNLVILKIYFDCITSLYNTSLKYQYYY